MQEHRTTRWGKTKLITDTAARARAAIDAVEPAIAASVSYAGIVAGSIHIHPQTLRLALAAKTNPERLFLVRMRWQRQDLQSRALQLSAIGVASGARTDGATPGNSPVTLPISWPSGICWRRSGRIGASPMWLPVISTARIPSVSSSIPPLGDCLQSPRGQRRWIVRQT